MSTDLAGMAAATLLASFTGPDVPAWLQRRVDQGLGGVCLFGSNLRLDPGPAEGPELARGAGASADTGAAATPPAAGSADAGVRAAARRGSAAAAGGAARPRAGGAVPTGRDADAGVRAAARVSAALHAVRPSVVVALDEEGGDVTRLDAHVGSPVPGSAALGAVDDVALTRRLAHGLGLRLATAGIDLDLAPCADANTDPANPVIGVRSFGADPALVARHTAAFVEGLQIGGVAACAKHFPGHGATTVDSHLGLPVVDAPVEVLRSRELVPFQAAVDAGAAAVMLGHLRMPAFDDRPATVSPRLATGLLRHEMGFGGVVVTDALDMAGIGGPSAIPTNVVRAVAAGADLCCLGPDATDELIAACIDALVTAVRQGFLDSARLADAADRVASLGRRLGVAPFWTRPAGQDLSRPRPEPAAAGGAVVGELALAELGAEAARRALRVGGDLGAPIGPAHVVELRSVPNIAAGLVPWGVAGPLTELDPATTSEQLDPAGGGTPPSPAGPAAHGQVGVDEGLRPEAGDRSASGAPPAGDGNGDVERGPGAGGHSMSAVSPRDSVAGVLARAQGRRLVVVVRDVHRRPANARLVAALVAARPDAVVVDMGWPRTRSEAGPGAGPELAGGWAGGQVSTFGASRASGEAVAHLLAGLDGPPDVARHETSDGRSCG